MGPLSPVLYRRDTEAESRLAEVIRSPDRSPPFPISASIPHWSWFQPPGQPCTAHLLCQPQDLPSRVPEWLWGGPCLRAPLEQSPGAVWGVELSPSWHRSPSAGGQAPPSKIRSWDSSLCIRLVFRPQHGKAVVRRRPGPGPGCPGCTLPVCGL